MHFLAVIPLLLSTVCAQNVTNTSSSDNNTVYTTPYRSSASDLAQYGNLSTTLRAVWMSETGKGVFNDGLNLLNGNTSSSISGALLEFNTSSPVNATRTSIPFVVLISCDQVVPTNLSDLDPGSTSNSSASNTTVGGGDNGNNTSAMVTIFDSAYVLGAVAAILYSSSNQSCILENATSLTTSIPVYSLPSRSSSALLQQQFSYINSSFTKYNSSLLASLGPIYDSLSQNPSNLSSQSIPFLIATISPNQTFENTSPIVATIGSVVPASSTTRLSPTATGGSDGGTGSGSGSVVTPLPTQNTTSGSKGQGIGLIWSWTVWSSAGACLWLL